MNILWINLIRKDAKEKLEIEIGKDNPDYLIYATYGCEKYNERKGFIDDFFVDNILNERKKFLMHIFEQKKEYAKRVDKYHFDFRDN